MIRKLSAEFFGTFWLVFGGCGSAVLAAGFPDLGIGFVGVSLAFGLTVLTMAYAVGHISGGHFNPAVSLGLAIGGRFGWGELVPYWVAQVLGGIVAAAVLYIVASGAPNWTPGGFASNGFGALSLGGYGLMYGGDGDDEITTDDQSVCYGGLGNDLMGSGTRDALLRGGKSSAD